MKKGWKIALILGASILILGGVWAGLTKIGVIPNRFEIKFLSTNSSGNTNCVDCKSVRYHGMSPKEVPTSIDGEICCEGTYDIVEIPIMGGEVDAFKPIIYLYPLKETKISITLGNPKNLSHTYPKYNSDEGWNVIARPNGDLNDLDSGRKLYALYREGKSDIESNFDEGFVVAGKDIIPFFEEKLEILGLNEREAEEFIIYWLPQMEDNEWNLIRFETIEEQNNNMPLIITPEPDSIIRIMMDWKTIDEPIEIPEQKLVTVERTGFTVVERGGSPRN